MAAELKPYRAYKDSGVKWLGAVPAHWEVRHLGRFGRLFKGGGGTKEDARESGVPCVRYGDLYTQHQFFITATRACVTPELANTVYTPIRYGDVLFAGSGETIDEIGKSAVNLIPGPACCGGDVIILRPCIDADARFLGYAMDCAATARQKACIGRGFTVVHIYSSDLKYVTVAIPSLPEQAAIVRFLDHADRRIRRYIRAKKKLMALLEEQKQAMIHQAVTGQIDVRTRRPYPAYKPSGVQWLRDVPAHWDLRPAKWHYREADVRSETGMEELLSVSHITGVTPRSEKSVTMFRAESNIGHKLCRPGDLVINTMWAWMAALGVARQGGLVSPAYAVYRPRSSPQLKSEYVDLLLRTAAYKSEYMRRSTGIRSSRLRLYPEEFLRIKLLCPDVEEQRSILDFAAGESAKVRRSVEAANSELSLLREYRTRLIADVATGKLDVREAAARLPEVDPLVVEDDADDDSDPEVASTGDPFTVTGLDTKA